MNIVEKIGYQLALLYEFIESVPALKAGAFTALCVTGLIFLNEHLPEAMRIDTSNELFKHYAFLTIVSGFFLMLSIFSGEKLRIQLKLQSIAQNFRYDHRGTLYNGGQPNISFRVTTLKRIFEALAIELGNSDLGKILEKTGKDASKDFASNLEEIYRKDVAKHKMNGEWHTLPFDDKLNQWAEYDSATGWGMFSCSVEEEKVKVTVTHHHGLFEGTGGQMFGKFLAGYVETILSVVLENHRIGRYKEFKHCTLENDILIGKSALEITYILT